MEAKKVHLVLGSGGARGMAHIGVVEELEAAGYQIVEVIGCSMGAVVGGIYAAGHLSAYRDWLLNLSRADVWRLMDFTLTRQGFVKGEKVFSAMIDLVGHRKIEELAIPFTAVAANLSNREELYYREGDLFQALRASISIPGLFTPVQVNNSVVVDGGVLNPLPVNLVQKKDPTDLTVAVNINAKTLHEYCEEPGEEKEAGSSWISRQWPFSRKEANRGLSNYSVIELMQTTFDFTQDRLTEAMLELHPPDMLIEIPRTTCGLMEFHRAEEIIALGRESFHLAHEKLKSQSN